MALSTAFSEPKIAQTTSAILLIVPLILILQVLQTANTHKWLVYPLFLLPVTPPVTLLMRFCASDEYGDVALFDLHYVNEKLAWAFLALSVPLWFAAYLYLDAVVPSEYGINKHPCFCLRRGGDADDDEWGAEEAPRLLTDPEAGGGSEDTDYYSSRDPIRLQHLTKRFGAFTAVDKLHLSIRQGEVYTILGHNGAGKTTTIFMLTGVLKPSGGNATVYGHQIKSQIDLVQQNLGLCQQFDVLFDQLTIKQHLQLTCAIKCMPED